MEVLGSALKHGVDSDDVDHALQHALVIEEVGEDPSRYLVLGPDCSANLLGLVVLIAQPASSDPCNADASAVPATFTATREVTRMTKQAKNVSRPDLPTPVRAEDYVDEAEQGYNVDQILRRRSGRPAMGSAAASVESVRLDPELKRDLLLRAAEDNTSVSEVIRSAIGAYLQAG